MVFLIKFFQLLFDINLKLRERNIIGLVESLLHKLIPLSVLGGLKFWNYILLKLLLELLSLLVNWLLLIIVALIILFRPRVLANLIHAEFVMIIIRVFLGDELESSGIFEERRSNL